MYRVETKAQFIIGNFDILDPIKIKNVWSMRDLFLKDAKEKVHYVAKN